MANSRLVCLGGGGDGDIGVSEGKPGLVVPNSCEPEDGGLRMSSENRRVNEGNGIV